MPASSHHLANLKQLGQGVVSKLARWNADSRFYSIDILNYDESNQKCSVRFEDNYECLLHRMDIHLQLVLGYIDDEQIVCCICDGGNSVAPNELILCDVCQQGFHLQCHQPNVDRSLLDDENNEWLCSTCKQLCASDDNNVPRKAPSRRPKSVTPKRSPVKLQMKQQAPKSGTKVSPKGRARLTALNLQTPTDGKKGKKSTQEGPVSTTKLKSKRERKEKDSEPKAVKDTSNQALVEEEENMAKSSQIFNSNFNDVETAAFVEIIADKEIRSEKEFNKLISQTKRTSKIRRRQTPSLKSDMAG